MNLVYGSVCSGIEAASVAWHPLGWRASFLSEIEAFPRAVLAHHYPETPLHGDFTTIEAGQYEPIDLLVGGTPCQSFSIAGLRGGLDDDRGNLALEYLRLADRLRPRWLVWENVPGVLSSNGGRDFGAILGGMVELGYGFAYRVLDAQFLGVAQRRRRVFVVGYLGDWRRAAAVLFERHSLSGHPAPSRETRKDVASRAGSGVESGRGLGWPADISPTLNAAFGSKLGLENQHIDSGAGMFVAHTLKGEGFDASEDGTGRGTPIVPVKAYSIMPMNSGKDFKGRETDIAQPVMAAGPAGGNQGGDYIVQPIVMMERGRIGGSNLEHRQDGTANAILTPNGGRGGLGVGAVAIPFDTTQITSAANYSNPQAGDPCHPLASGAHAPAIAGSAVRRLTPTECERLQGFPDRYTAIQMRGKPAADGPRYKALGNSMAVPVMAWIGQRIAAVDAIPLQQRAAA